MEEEEWLRFGVAAALSRQYAADQRRFLESLAQMLEQALPGEVRVIRRGGLFFWQRPVREIRVTLGDHRYALEDPGRSPLTARRTLTKRGIVLNTQDLPVDAWIQELCGELEERARHNRSICQALKRLAG
jgi:hypothetical protein